MFFRQGLSLTWTRSMILTLLMLACQAVVFPVPDAAANPRTPFPASVKALGTSPADWVAEGGGFLAYGRGATVNLALPEDPSKVLYTFTLDAPVSGAVLVWPYAYFAQEGLGLRVVDLTVPSQWVDLGLIPVQGDHLRVGLAEGRLVVAVQGALTIFDVNHTLCPDGPGEMCMGPADPFDVAQAASIPLSGIPSALAGRDGHVVVAMESGSPVEVELSAPFRAVPLPETSGPGSETAAASFSGGLALGLSGTGAGKVQVFRRKGSVEVDHVQGLAAEGRVLFAAAGDGGLYQIRDETAAAATVSVNVANFFFSPSVVDINQGDQVHWVWVTGTHSTTSGGCPGGNCTPDGTWDSGIKGSGTFNFTFNTAAAFPYYCRVHLSAMTGKVNVASTGPTPLSASASAAPLTGVVPLTVAFTGAAAGGTAPYTYAWTFGDGSADSSQQNPSHTYSQSGTYSAVLTVTDSASGTAQAAPISITATLPSSNPPVITTIKKAPAPPFGLVVIGSNLQNGIKVYIGGAEWTRTIWKKTTKIKIAGGKALKAVVPKGSTTPLLFVNPDGGSATASFTW